MVVGDAYVAPIFEVLAKPLDALLIRKLGVVPAVLNRLVGCCYWRSVEGVVVLGVVGGWIRNGFAEFLMALFSAANLVVCYLTCSGGPVGWNGCAGVIYGGGEWNIYGGAGDYY